MAQSKELFHENDVRARLVAFNPGTIFREHQHERIFATYMLFGVMRETTEGEEDDFPSPHFGLMPAGYKHANHYGPTGGLYLVFDFPPKEFFRFACNKQAERLIRRLDLKRLTPALQRWINSPNQHRQEGLSDLLSLTLSFNEPGAASAPSWLNRARQFLDDDPGGARISDVAAEAGVHRSHLVRVFKDCLGVAPSEYRLQSMTSRAVSMMRARYVSLSEIASEAGFADYSHFARELKRRLGVSPYRLSRLLSE